METIPHMSIVVPYRNRQLHLEKFVPHMVNFLKNINYEILIIEQFDSNPFNRAKLLNIGFDINKDKSEYFAFHDIDMLPIEADYSFPEKPYHMATNASQFNNNLPYYNYYGGVNLINKDDFLLVNGYSNDFWGWGGEDDDFLNRVKSVGYDIFRRRGVYISLEHEQNGPLHNNYKNNLNKLKYNYSYTSDGVNTLQYKKISDSDMSDYRLVKVTL